MFVFRKCQVGACYRWHRAHHPSKAPGESTTSGCHCRSPMPVRKLSRKRHHSHQLDWRCLKTSLSLIYANLKCLRFIPFALHPYWTIENIEKYWESTLKKPYSCYETNHYPCPTRAVPEFGDERRICHHKDILLVHKHCLACQSSRCSPPKGRSCTKRISTFMDWFLNWKDLDKLET